MIYILPSLIIGLPVSIVDGDTLYIEGLETRARGLLLKRRAVQVESVSKTVASRDGIWTC